LPNGSLETLLAEDGMRIFHVLLLSLVASTMLAPDPAGGDATLPGSMVRLYGSPAMMERVFEPERDRLRESLGVGLFLAGIGEGNGLESLIDGECEAAMLSSPLEDALADLTRFGRRDIPRDLTEHVVTSERVWVMVNPSNPVPSLTRGQLEGIFRGRITNWREVGGPDLRIVPVQPPSGSASRKALVRELLGGDTSALRGMETAGAKDVANYVRFLDGAVGAMPVPALPPNYMKFRVVETAEIRYGLYLVTIGVPSAEVGRILEFLTVGGRRVSLN
jgi:phosphate transport system substrate-binding protein